MRTPSQASVRPAKPRDVCSPAKDKAKRVLLLLLLGPDNLNMRYNFSCAFAARRNDSEMAFELLGPLFENIDIELLNRAKTDPDSDSIRGDPRFKTLLAAAEARLSAKQRPH